MKREGRVAEPRLVLQWGEPPAATSQGARTPHDRRTRVGRATLTPLLIQMYKDTSYRRERGPGEGGQDARGGGSHGRPGPV